MEIIRKAAIRFILKNESDFSIVEGDNHGECIQLLGILGHPRIDRQMDKEVQGFITSTGRFVDRSEAYQIAKEAGQLIREDGRGLLDSYNIKWGGCVANKEGV